MSFMSCSPFGVLHRTFRKEPEPLKMLLSQTFVYIPPGNTRAELLICHRLSRPETKSDMALTVKRRRVRTASNGFMLYKCSMGVSSKQQDLFLGDKPREWLLLSQMYPVSGIVGVVEEPVEPNMRFELRQFLNIHDAMLVDFSRIVSVKGLSAEWFLEGDIICRYVGIHEEYADVLREKVDMLMYHRRFIGRVDWQRVEKVRSLAIEHHRWEVDRVRMDDDEWSVKRFGQTVLCDPFGRTMIYVGPRSKRLWGRPFEQIDPTHHKRMNYVTPSFRISAAWIALRVGFHRMLNKWNSREYHNDYDSSLLLTGVEEVVHRVYGMRTRFSDKYSLDDRVVRVRLRKHGKGHKHMRKFWVRVFEDEGKRASPWLQKIIAHPSMQWIALTVSEYEELLSFCKYEEWDMENTYKVEALGHANNSRWK